MLRIRLIEEALADNYGAPGSEQEMRCPMHLSIGQEAAAVGVCAALQPDDVVFSTHRCHAHYLAKGGSLNRMLAEIFGKVDGCTGGRGGSMHLMDDEAGLVASIPIVGASMPLAVGAALSFALDGVPRISVAFVGDAAMEEGAWHECANFASLNRLPVLFVCENNYYSVYTPLSQRQNNSDLTRFAVAHGMDIAKADGNDIEAVLATAEPLIERVRKRQGPGFLMLPTYRYREHCGPNYDDHLGYRPKGELEHWMSQDPLPTYHAKLMKDEILTDAGVTDITQTIMAEIESGLDFARRSPLPEPAQAPLYVYAE